MIKFRLTAFGRTLFSFIFLIQYSIILVSFFLTALSTKMVYCFTDGVKPARCISFTIFYKFRHFHHYLWAIFEEKLAKIHHKNTSDFMMTPLIQILKENKRK